ncbi:hypothetical protein SAMN04244548_04930 [Paracoccus pantotrophus]|nr:hypothetical protein SAMN04244548_04930 [Paracoccus pantotrophus]
MPCAILRTVEVASGHKAICTEKALHARLRAAHPDAVVDPLSYRGQIRVRSEIYDARLTPQVLALLEDLGTQAEAA